MRTDREIQTNFPARPETDIIDALPVPALLADLSGKPLTGNDLLLSFLCISDIHQLDDHREKSAQNSRICPGAAADFQDGDDMCPLCAVLNVIQQTVEGELPVTLKSTFLRQERNCSEDNSKPYGHPWPDASKGRGKYTEASLSTRFVTLENRSMLLLTMEDHSAEMRKECLQRIFLHDITNTAGSLKGILTLLDENSSIAEQGELITMSKQLAEHLTDEIIAHRQLTAAEEGDLEYQPATVSAREIMEQTTECLAYHAIIENKEIKLDRRELGHDNLEKLFIYTDPVILQRVMINLLKNALEATKPGGHCRFSCSKNGDSVQFSVWNQGEISEKLKKQLFVRSISTKSGRRGLGTYSVKLLTEEYLRGTVGFTSCASAGTTFFIHLPLSTPA